MTADTDGLAARLHGLWSSEGCGIDFRYDPADYSNPAWWNVDLLFDTTNDHAVERPEFADEATYRWHFYDETLAGALDAAVAWCEALAATRDEGSGDE